MKYLAAYALLALSGKKDISTLTSTQPPMTSNLSSAASNPTPAMLKSMKWSKHSRASPFTNSSLKDKADSEMLPPLLLAKLLRRRSRRRRRSPRRRKNPRRRKSLRLKHPKNNKTPIWEISSDDTHSHIYSFVTIHSQNIKYNIWIISASLELDLYFSSLIVWLVSKYKHILL